MAGLMPINAQKMRWETLRSRASGAITGSYQILGSPFAVKPRLIKVVNTTDVDILISDDMTRDVDIAPSNSAFIYDITSNASVSAGVLALSEGDVLYIKHMGVAATSGSVYLVSIYASAA